MYGVVHHKLRHELGINDAEYVVLFHLYICSIKKGFCDKPIRVISDELYKSSATVRKIIKKLEQKELIFQQGNTSNSKKFVTVKIRQLFKKQKTNSVQNGLSTPSNLDANSVQNGLSTPSNLDAANIDKGLDKGDKGLDKGGGNAHEGKPTPTPPKNQKEILLNFLFSDTKKPTFSKDGLNQLEMVANHYRLKVPPPTKILVEVHEWNAKTSLTWDDFKKWDLDKCLNHFCYKWFPRIKPDKKENPRTWYDPHHEELKNNQPPKINGMILYHPNPNLKTA